MVLNSSFSCRDKEEENMDDWDESKLEEVISKKHGSEKSNATDIVSLFNCICQFFH